MTPSPHRASLEATGVIVAIDREYKATPDSVRNALQGSGLTDCEIDEYVGNVSYGASLKLTLRPFAQLAGGQRVFAYRHQLAQLDGVDASVSEEFLIAKAMEWGVKEKAAADNWANLVRALRAEGKHVDPAMLAGAPFRIEVTDHDPGPGLDRGEAAG